jgi:hypothetical protein
MKLFFGVITHSSSARPTTMYRRAGVYGRDMQKKMNTILHPAVSDEMGSVSQADPVTPMLASGIKWE